MAFTTRMSVLARVREGSEVGWQEFHDMYRALILLRGGDRGLRPAEKEDLVQDVLLAFFKQHDRFVYDRAKGRFRNYLRTIIDRCAFKIIRRRPPAEREISVLEADGVFLASDDNEKFNARWDRAWEQLVLQQALDEVRDLVKEQTYAAFRMYALDGIPPADIAEALGLSVASVYVAKNRVVERLRGIVAAMGEDWDCLAPAGFMD
jgi:RNA polymerase sigma factor (sigma-70 family)